MIELSNIALPLDAGVAGGRGEALTLRAVARAAGLREGDIREIRLLKRSVDARKKRDVHFVATFAVALASPQAEECLLANPQRLAHGVRARAYEPPRPLAVPDCAAAFERSGEPRPVVAGTGPAGLFAALYLARAGLRPLVVERGACVEERLRAIEAFNEGGPLDEAANVQFGEGGAGTFSDGKLNTGTKSPHIRHVLEEFTAAGAPADILWQAKPHVGTDKLAKVVRNLRKQIVAAGGEVRFLTQLTELGFGEDGRLAKAVLQNVRSGEEEELPTRRLVLACGHSARDTLHMLRDRGLRMERKPFAVGVRIEHPQALIDEAQHGIAAGHPALGAADYKLAVHLPDGRGVYTFCMCPGGQVVAAASEAGGVCVNGMSRHARDGRNANSALLVGVEPDDLPGEDVLAGVHFQRSLERAAYGLGGGEYIAPVQTVGDFLAGESGRESALVQPSYPRGAAWKDLRECLPGFVTDALVEALPLLDRKLRGFAHPQAVMTGVEARSSSPVRILRDESFQAQHAAGGDCDVPPSGVYPCGEGAGYAGGIMSAAVDGLRVAERIAADFAAAEGGRG